MVEDDELQSRLLAGYLSQHDFDITTVDTIAALKAEVTAGHHFDVVLLDLGMPDGDGLDEITMLRSGTAWGILIVSSESDDDVRIKALESGADEYIVKPFSPRELVARINGLIGRLLPAASTKTPLIEFLAVHSLTRREGEILTLLARGMRRKQIADLLNITLNTTADHIKNIYRKLSVRSSTEALGRMANVDLDINF